MSAIFTDPTTISSTPGVGISPSNCVLWLDGSDVSTFYQLSTNTGPGYSTPVVSDGDPIGAWLDKSMYGNHAGVSTTTNRPTYQNFSVFFDGITTKWLEVVKDTGIFTYRTNTTDPLSGLTYFVVSETSTNTSSIRTIVAALTTTNTPLAYNSTGITVPNLIQTSNSFQVHTLGIQRLTHGLEPDYLTVLTPTRTIITTVYAYNGALQLMVGGNPVGGGNTQTTSASIHNNPDTTVRRLRIGADLNNILTPNNPYIGRIREIIVYNTQLTFQQQKMVEAYLGEKWKASYNSYADSSGNFGDGSIWFNNVVPTLSTAVVIPNGFNITINTSGVYPRLQNKNFTNWGFADPGISKGGTFIINGGVDMVTEYVLQDVPWGGLTRTPNMGQTGGFAVSPVLTIPTGATLNLSAQRIQALSYNVPVVRVTNGTLNTTVPLLYGHSTSSAIVGETNSSITITNSTLATTNRWNTNATTQGTAITVQSGTTCTLLSCTLSPTHVPNLLTEGGSFPNANAVNNCTHVYNNNATTNFIGCRISGYGTNGSWSLTNPEANGVGVLLNATTGVTQANFTDCLIQCDLVTSQLIVRDRIGVDIVNGGATATFDRCIINGSSFNTSTPTGVLGNAGVNVRSGGFALFNECIITGGAGEGTLTNTTQRYDQLATYPAAIRLTGATSNLTLSSCTINGSSVSRGQGIHINSSGGVNTFNCKYYAGPVSNAINGTTNQTVNIAGQIIEDSFTGYRAITLPRFFINPVTKNSYIRYATNGTGVGFDAFTYQYTVDSLSAFSMPDVSAVRFGTPYAGGYLVGTAVIPPPAAVSYGTLVDNTTGTAILTLDLLNSLFMVPVSAFSTPPLTSSIGYRVANALTTNQSVGHLIASFTTN